MAQPAQQESAVRKGPDTGPDKKTDQEPGQGNGAKLPPAKADQDQSNSATLPKVSDDTRAKLMGPSAAGQAAKDPTNTNGTDPGAAQTAATKQKPPTATVDPTAPVGAAATKSKTSATAPTPAPDLTVTLTHEQGKLYKNWNIVDDPEMVKALSPAISEKKQPMNWLQRRRGMWYNNQGKFTRILQADLKSEGHGNLAGDVFRQRNNRAKAKHGVNLHEVARQMASKRPNLFLDKDDCVSFRAEIPSYRGRAGGKLFKRLGQPAKGIEIIQEHRPTNAAGEDLIAKWRELDSKGLLKIEEPPKSVAAHDPLKKPTAPPIGPDPKVAGPGTGPTTSAPAAPAVDPAKAAAAKIENSAQLVITPELERLLGKGNVPADGRIDYDVLAKGMQKALLNPTRDNIDSAFSIVNGRSRAEMDKFIDAYKEVTKRDFEADINSKIKGDDNVAFAARQDLLDRMRGFDAQEHADKLFNSVDGAGTTDEQLQRSLVGLSREQAVEMNDRVKNYDQAGLVGLVEGDMYPYEIRARIPRHGRDKTNDTNPKRALAGGIDVSRYIYHTDNDAAAERFAKGVKNQDIHGIQSIYGNPNISNEELGAIFAKAEGSTTLRRTIAGWSNTKLKSYAMAMLRDIEDRIQSE